MWNFKKAECMAKKEDNKMTILRLLFLCVRYSILTVTEAENCFYTGELPLDILQRLRQIEDHEKLFTKAKKN
jgi:hypothetical protein